MTMNDSFVLSGDLNFLTLADLLQLLGSNGSSGTLQLTTQYASDPGFIYIEKGNPINAFVNKLTGIDAVYSLFGWVNGKFKFSVGKLSCDKNITKNRMEIILDGLRMLDDGDIKKIGQNANKISRTVESSHLNTDTITSIKGPLIDYMYIVDEEKFFDGEEIIEEKKHGSWMWVILSGVVEIKKETDYGEKTLFRVGDGAFIGSLGSFLERGHSRTATAVAVGNVQLGVLDTQRIAGEYACLSQESRQIVRSIERRLNQVTKRVYDTAHKDTTLRHDFKNSFPVILQGDKHMPPSIITHGEAYIIKKTAKGDVYLATLSKGDILGEFPFLDMGHEPLSAAVYGSENLETKKLDYNRIVDEYRNLSSIFKKILDYYALCISITTNMVCDTLNPDQGDQPQ